MTGPLGRARTWLAGEGAAYAAPADDDRPLGGYLGAMGAFALLTTAVGALTAQRRPAGQPVSTRDLVLVGISTHKLARIVSKDAVSSPLRAPFTTFKEPGGPGEVVEEVRGHGARHAVGELLTCPFCMSPWIATTLVGGLALAPTLTRTVTTVFSAVTVADALQFAYAAMEKSAG